MHSGTKLALMQEMSFMTQQHENLSAFMDGEVEDEAIINAIKNDRELQDKWRSYHVIRSGLRKEASVMPEFDITAQVAAALADEPTVMAPKSRLSRLPLVNKVVPFIKQGGQYAVAASVAAAVILGFQTYNTPAPTEPFATAQTMVSQAANLAPVSLQQPVSMESNQALTREEMEILIQKRRQLNALIADHEQQVKLKNAQQQSDAAETEAEEIDKP